jgi:hypothetical protein
MIRYMRPLLLVSVLALVPPANGATLAEQKSSHFTFHYPASDAANIAGIAESVEREDARIVDALGVADLPRVHVTFYTSHDALEAATRGVAGVVRTVEISDLRAIVGPAGERSRRVDRRPDSDFGGEDMTQTTRFRIATAATLVFLGSIPAHAAEAPAAAPAREKGDLWEVTSKMSMEGMPMDMPAQKVKVCAPKTWTEPPAPENQQQACTNSDFHLDGPKATWKVTCGPPHPMTGTGEIIRDGDAAYSGSIKFVSADGILTIKLDGSRVDECDKPRR